MTCELCEVEEGDIIYQDKEIVVAVRDLAATPGQIAVFPKEHFTILELVPEDLLKKCAAVAKKVTAAVFDGLGSQGTNVIIRNGLGAGQNVPHFSIDVIPRQENDALDLQWEPKPMMEDETEITLAAIKEILDKPEVKIEKKEDKEEKKQKTKKDKNNYMLKSIKRIP